MSIPNQPATGSNTQTIARNSFWYGIELGFQIVANIGTSIAVARIIGPEKLGYFNYIGWLTTMTGIVGSLGVPAATRKYMAEYLGAGEPGLARAVYHATNALQARTAILLTAVAVTCAALFAEPEYRLVAVLLTASILPAMAVFVPSQANTAREDMKANVVSALVAVCVYAAGVFTSLYMGWGVTGIGGSLLLSRSVEFVLRFVTVRRWIRTLPLGELPPGFKKRMTTFSGYSTALMLLHVIVWDRSDVIFLRMLSKDLSQISFFTVPFNLTEKALTLPQTFGYALGASVMAQYGRDKLRVATMASAAAKYMFLLSAPLLLGLAALSGPTMKVLYGPQYVAAIPVLAVAAAYGIVRPLLAPAQQVLQAHEKQRFLVLYMCACGVLNIALDLALIPLWGAMGAAVANGTAQVVAVVGVWVRAGSELGIRLDLRGFVRIGASAAVMALLVIPIAALAPPWLALILGVLAGVVAFGAMLRWTSALNPEDAARLLALAKPLPGRVRPLYTRLVHFIIPPRPRGGTTVPAAERA